MRGFWGVLLIQKVFFCGVTKLEISHHRGENGDNPNSSQAESISKNVKMVNLNILSSFYKKKKKKNVRTPKPKTKMVNSNLN